MCPLKRVAAISLLVWYLVGGVSFGLTAYIPHLTSSASSWLNYLQVDNSNDSAASFTLTFYTDGTQTYQASFNVNGLSELKLQLLTPSSYTIGVITYTDPQLNFRCTYWCGGMAEFNLTDDRFQTLGCYFSDISQDLTWKGMALANFNSTSAAVTLYAVGGGSILGTTTISIAAYSKVLNVYNGWFPNVSFSAIKKIIAKSDSSHPLCGVVISGSTDNSHLLFTPATELSSFDGSNPPSTLNLTGTWRGAWNSQDTSLITRANSGQITAQLTQQGTSVGGTLSLTNTDCGNPSGIVVTGSVSGNTASFETASINCQGSSASLEFDGNVAGSTMTGDYVTYVDGEHYDYGTFTITKQ